jgi:LPXTG cell wall anchor motif
MPEQRPLVVGELQGPIGVRREGRALPATGANPRMTLAIGGSLGAVGPAVARIRRRCGFLRALGLL